MKARFPFSLIIAFSTLLVLSGLTSCTPDKCTAIACAHGGLCQDGTCLCADGYEGYQCETEMRARYITTWTVTEDGTVSNAAQYAVGVAPGSTPRQIRITNFYNAFTQPVIAYVNSDTVVIPLQSVNRWKVQGRGRIQRDPYQGENARIVFNYVIQDTVQNLIDNFGYSGGDPSVWTK